ncbi:uncharacterized protein [Drosophila suzukii]|uniref:Uncharacterized protein isoform X1 n=1 Tax=Drosophila suzukii TaxID=28584 RepID=A0ABM4TZR6_DROSZ
MAIVLSAAMRPLEVPEMRRTRYAGTDSPGNVDVVGVDCGRPFWMVVGTGRTDTGCWAAKSGCCICLDCWTVWPRLSRYLLIIAPPPYYMASLNIGSLDTWAI